MEIDQEISGSTCSTYGGSSSAAVSSTTASSDVVKPYGVKGDISRMACADIDKVFKQMLALERGQLPGGPPAPLDGRRCPYNPEARYIKYRRLLVDWLSELGEDYQLANTTIHAAVEIMDRFLQSMEVHRTRYQLVAMAAFAIAAKYEEAEERVPSSTAINEYAHHSYPPKLIHQMEIAVLMRLNWCLTSTTALHFLGYFHSKGLLWAAPSSLSKSSSANTNGSGGTASNPNSANTSQDENVSGSSLISLNTSSSSTNSGNHSNWPSDTMAFKSLVSSVPKYLKKYTDFFADLALQDYAFQQYQPSLLATAIILAARKSLVIRPLWHPALEELTGYQESQVLPAMSHLWAHYCNQFPAESEAQEVAASEADKKALASGKASLRSLPPYCSLWAQQAHHNADTAAAEVAARAAMALVASGAGSGGGALLGVSRGALEAAAANTPSLNTSGGAAAVAMPPFTPYHNGSNQNDLSSGSLHSANSGPSAGTGSSNRNRSSAGKIGSPDSAEFRATALAIGAAEAAMGHTSGTNSNSSFSALLASVAGINGQSQAVQPAPVAAAAASSRAAHDDLLLRSSGYSTFSSSGLADSGVSTASGASGATLALGASGAPRSTAKGHHQGIDDDEVERALLGASGYSTGSRLAGGHEAADFDGFASGLSTGTAAGGPSSEALSSSSSTGITPAFSRAMAVTTASVPSSSSSSSSLPMPMPMTMPVSPAELLPPAVVTGVAASSSSSAAAAATTTTTTAATKTRTQRRIATSTASGGAPSSKESAASAKLSVKDLENDGATASSSSVALMQPLPLEPFTASARNAANNASAAGAGAAGTAAGPARNTRSKAAAGAGAGAGSSSGTFNAASAGGAGSRR